MSVSDRRCRVPFSPGQACPEPGTGQIQTYESVLVVLIRRHASELGVRDIKQHFSMTKFQLTMSEPPEPVFAVRFSGCGSRATSQKGRNGLRFDLELLSMGVIHACKTRSTVLFG